MKPDLEAIRERVGKATAGPWTLGKGSKTVRIEHKTGMKAFIARTHLAGEYRYLPEAEQTANADFIAHSRADIPALLAHIDSLERVREAAAGVIANYDRHIPGEIESIRRSKKHLEILRAALSAAGMGGK